MGDLKVRKLTREDIETELRNFEGRFGLTSADFYEKYNRGEMGDSVDVIEWAGLYEWSLAATRRTRRVRT